MEGGGDYASVGAGDTWDSLYFPLNVSVKPKTSLKKKSLFKKLSE